MRIFLFRFISHGCRKLSLFLVTLVVCLGLTMTYEIYQGHAAAIIHSADLAVKIGNISWSDDFNDISGLEMQANVQISEGQLILANDALMGMATSVPISPGPAVRSWGRLYFTATIPVSTVLTVDVLDTTGTPVMHNVPNGGSLAGIDAAMYPTLKLRATLSTTPPGQSPSLDEWRITWTPDYPYQIYLPLAGKSFSNDSEPLPPPLGAAIGFTGANSEHFSGKIIYFPSVRKNEANWNSSFAVQNISGFATTLVVEFFREDGSIAYTTNGIPLRPHGTYTAALVNFPDLASGLYALRVTATEPVVGMVSTLHATGRMAMAYNGSGRASQTILAPRIFKNYAGWTSEFCIHHTTDSTAYITINYYGASGSMNASRILELPGNGANCTNLAQEPLLPSFWTGSAIVTTGDANFTVTVDEVNLPNDLALSYLGFDPSVASATLYIPRFQVENNWHTNVLVCNAGPLATEIITASYHEFDGSYSEIEEFIDPPICLTYPPPMIGIPPFPSPNHLGSVIMSAGQSELIALVIDKHSLSAETDVFGYHGLPISSTTVYVPNVGAGLENWDTTLSIQNPNPVTNTVTLIFYNQTGDMQLELEEDLPPYGMGQHKVSELPGLPISFEGSAVISASSPVTVLASKKR